MKSRFCTSNIAVILATTVTGSVLAYYCFIRHKRKKAKKKWRAPFAEDSSRPREPLELNAEKRNLRIKKQFNESEVPWPLDAIVIGSGIGGLSVAAILAKTGRKVLVLEQHGKIGGCCQTFSKDDTEWDVGLHCVGEMDSKKDLAGFLLDQLTEGQLHWERLGDNYDAINLNNTGKTAVQQSSIMCCENSDQIASNLIEIFPDYAVAIREYSQMMRLTANLKQYFVFLKTIPCFLAKFVANLRFLVPVLGKFAQYFSESSLHQTLKQLFPENELIQTILAYNWGKCGTLPENLPFAISSCVFQHYSDGVYYPIGGPSEIGYSLIATIERSGGRVLTKARVKEILLSKDNRTAVGVRVESGNKNGLYDIKAPLIISNAGVSNTFVRLLPSQAAEKTTLGRLLMENRIKPGAALFEIFVGLNGSQHDLRLPTCSYSVFSKNCAKELDAWHRLSLEEAVQARIPYLWFDFPSAKDPCYDQRYPDRSTCSIFTFVPVRWFKPWSKQPKGRRSSDYIAFKMALAEQAWEQVVEHFPQLATKRRFMDAGSPATVEHYLNAINGEAYGLEHDLERFSPQVISALRPPVKEISNLYLTGQDVFFGGFGGALMGAFICASSILAETGETTNLMADLKKLMKQKQLSLK